VSATLLEQPREQPRTPAQAIQTKPAAPPLRLLVMVTAGGAAALSWEILWQINAALSLGVSALGTAVTLATLMGGMALGAAAMGAWLQRKPTSQPIRLYGCL